MTTKLLHLNCPEYQFDNLNLKKVSTCIDNALTEAFTGKKIILRGIQSEKHNQPKEQLIKKIIGFGSDRFETVNDHAVGVNDKYIDLFGLGCKVEGPISISILNGFHKWKPMSLEVPQRKVDIWMVYDADQLENVEYFHSHYKVMAHDGYIFKNPERKTEALLGVLVID